MILNLNDPSKSQVPYKYFLMPDGQCHIVFDNEPWKVEEIICSITSMNALGKLAVAVDALARIPGGIAPHLFVYIPYFLGARQDKIIVGEALTVDVMADMLNHILGHKNINSVYVLHPHSEAISFCIDQYEPWDHTCYVEKAIKDFEPDFLIIPDLGAAKNAKKYDKFGLPQVQCTKLRDPATGKLSGFDMLKGYPYDDLTEMFHDGTPRALILDDICDGGRTFLGIADLFKDIRLGLYVTHGLFTGGLWDLYERFEQVYCTDSYRYQPGYFESLEEENSQLTVFDVELP